MLHFSRMKAAAILLTAFVVCCFNIPNFFPEAAVKNWPAFAQRRLTLAPELQGGSSVLLEVDRNDVRAFLIESMRRGVRDALQDAHMHWAKAPRIRGKGVEVTLREADVQGGFAKLQGLPFDVIDAGGDLFRLTVREAAISERTRQIVDQSIPSMQKRFDEFGLVEATVTRQGSDRILVQMPGYGDPRQPFRIPMAAD